MNVAIKTQIFLTKQVTMPIIFTYHIVIIEYAYFEVQL